MKRFPAGTDTWRCITTIPIPCWIANYVRRSSRPSKVSNHIRDKCMTENETMDVQIAVISSSTGQNWTDISEECTWNSTATIHLVFSCPGSSIPDLRQWVSQSVGQCHFRISTQRVTVETSDPSGIWSEWCLDKKTKRHKDTKTKTQNVKRTESQKDIKTKRQKDKRTKRQKDTKTQRQKDIKT